MRLLESTVGDLRMNLRNGSLSVHILAPARNLFWAATLRPGAQSYMTSPLGHLLADMGWMERDRSSRSRLLGALPFLPTASARISASLPKMTSPSMMAQPSYTKYETLWIEGGVLRVQDEPLTESGLGYTYMSRVLKVTFGGLREPVGAAAGTDEVVVVTKLWAQAVAVESESQTSPRPRAPMMAE